MERNAAKVTQPRTTPAKASQPLNPPAGQEVPAADFTTLRNRLHIGAPALQRLADDRSLQVRQGGRYEAPAGDAGLPARLRGGLERLSGLAMDDVRVHRGSPRPAAIGALAFAQGNQIHLAPGQERHLPHEAWHTVQQKQGRVRATVQAKGIPVNADPGLEREADAMGQRAASLGPSGGVQDRPPTSLAATRAPDGGPVQRKVGFEFETGWLVTHNGAPLGKQDRIGTGVHNGFRVEADEAGEGASEIEFVVDPPVEEGAAGLAALEQIMTGVTQYGTNLETASGPPACQTAFSLDHATGVPGDGSFAVTPRGGPLTAGPQVTTGLDLAKMGDLKEIDDRIRKARAGELDPFLGDQEGTPAPRELTSTIASLQTGSRRIGDHHTESSHALRGLVALIRNYLRGGADRNRDDDLSEHERHMLALNYPKRIADSVLARTDFAKLFSMIPLREQRAFEHDPDSWVQFVLDVLDLDVKPGDSVIQRGVQVDEQDPALGITKPDLTVGAWLIGMISSSGGEGGRSLGVDHLRTIANAESMGALGERTETVGSADSLFGPPRQAGIFEFRGAQAQKIPLLRWRPFAAEFQQYVTAVHAD